MWHGEECDASGVNTAACDADCTLPMCGDGFTNPAAGEQCDDGNTGSCLNGACTARKLVAGMNHT